MGEKEKFLDRNVALTPIFVSLLIAIAPSLIVIAILPFYLIHEINYNSFELLEHTQRVLVGLFTVPLIIFLFNWPFITLSIFIYLKLKYSKKPNLKNIKRIMNGSINWMVVPNVMLLIGTPFEILSRSYDAGQGTGLWLFAQQFIVPILGIAGGFKGGENIIENLKFKFGKQ